MPIIINKKVLCLQKRVKLIVTSSLVYAIFIAWTFSSNASADLTTPTTLNIPSQRLSSALIELGKQAQISIIFPTGLSASEIKTQKIEGLYSPATALELLLNGRDIEWTSFNPRVVSLSRKTSSDIINKNIQQKKMIEEVLIIGQQVTGSRIKRLDFEGSSPVDIITEKEIASRGVQTISEYLKFIPAVSGNSTSTAVSNGGDGTATITLRGLPASNTLVLINGRRTSNSGLAGNSVDLNSIPLVAVERIEVLKDGASSIYGSDAIAGVVNIILKRRASGVLIDQYYGQTSRGDQETFNTNILSGFSTDNTDFMFSASHFDQKGIFSGDRYVSKNADGRSQGGVDNRSSATPFSRITLPNGDVFILQDALSDPQDIASYRSATKEDLYNYREETSSLSPSTRSAVNVSAAHLISENTELILQVGVIKTEATVTFAPQPIFTGFENEEIIIGSDNPFNPFGVDITDIRRRIVELGPRIQKSNEFGKRLNFQIEKSASNFHWDAAINLNRTKAEKKANGLADIQKIKESLSSACVLNIECAQLDLFGPPGSIDEAQLHFIRSHQKIEGSSKLSEFSLNGDTIVDILNISAIGLAGGISIREEVAELTSNNELETGIFFTDSKESRRVSEVYIEATIPLIKNTLMAYQLDFDIASRYSKYSDFGETNNPKFGLRYRPIKNLLLRNTYSKGFRAPSLDQLYQTESNSYDLLQDPCSMIDNVGVLAGCAQQSDPTRQQFLTVTGGNKLLLPEKSINKTFGLVWTPEIKGNLTMSFDWFQIDLDDVIDARAQYIIDQNAQSNLFPSQVIRDAQGNIITVYATNLNVGSLQVKGADTTIRYQLPNTRFGHFIFSTNGSYMHSYRQQSNPTSQRIDIAGQFSDSASDGQGAIPEWKINTGVSWSNNEWEVNYNINYIEDLSERIPESTQTRKIDSWITHSIQIKYSPKKLSGLNITLGIDNVFDDPPPFSVSAFNDNFDQRTYEIKGKSLYGRFSYQF
ncbi:MAG: TonB-dependent receptor [Cellvibrionaceae bacterium]